MNRLRKEIIAVCKTIEMWEWLRDNPGKGKIGYLNMRGIDYEDQPYAACYLCETFVDFENEDSCGNCPLNTKRLQCNVEGSPFDSWHYGKYGQCGDDKPAKHAQRLINACNRFLKKQGL